MKLKASLTLPLTLILFLPCSNTSKGNSSIFTHSRFSFIIVFTDFIEDPTSLSITGKILPQRMTSICLFPALGFQLNMKRSMAIFLSMFEDFSRHLSVWPSYRISNILDEETHECIKAKKNLKIEYHISSHTTTWCFLNTESKLDKRKIFGRIHKPGSVIINWCSGWFGHIKNNLLLHLHNLRIPPSHINPIIQYKKQHQPSFLHHRWMSNFSHQPKFLLPSQYQMLISLHDHGHLSI